jgi:hypothetical protein
VAGGIVAAMLVPATGVLASTDTTVTVGGPATVNPGQTFTVPITINTSKEVRGWQLEVTYDPTVLTYNAPPVEGGFISNWAGTGNFSFNNGIVSSGEIDAFGCAQTGGPVGGATGTGTLVNLSFTVKAGAAVGSSAITIVTGTDSFVSDQNAVTIADAVFNSGTFNVVWPTPTITSFTPTFGGNGVNITINGTNLSSASAVSFGGTAATAIVSNTATQIVATVGAGATGSVSVTNPGGTVTATGFTFVAAPTISAISPATGTTGTTVTITGTGFNTVANNVQSATIGGVALTGVTTVSGTSITGVVAGATPVGADNVIVTTYGGPSNPLANAFTFTAPGGSISVTPAAQNVSSFVAPFSVTLTGSLASPTQLSRGWSATIQYNPQYETFEGFTLSSAFVNFANANSGMSVWASPASLTAVSATQEDVTIGGAFLGGSNTVGMNYNNTPLATVNFQALSVDGTLPVSTTTNTISVVSAVMDDLNANAIANVIAAASPANGDIVTFTFTCPEPTVPTVPATTMNIPATVAPVLTFIAPWDICCWNLVPSQENTAQRTMTVYSNASWQVQVSASNNGYMKDGAVALANPLQVSATAGTGNGGTGNNVTLSENNQVLATGNPAGQVYCYGGDMRTLMFTQPVLWTDTPAATNTTGSLSGYYSVVVNFTASITNW